MIKKLFNNKILHSRPAESVISAAFIITVAQTISNVMGLFRDRLLASTFGAGDTLDIYYAAFRIPDLIYSLLILGALSAAFIPVFTGLVSKKQDDEAWQLANSMVNLAIIFIVVLSVVFAVFAPLLMRLITPGFPPEKMAQVVLFTRIMFLSPLFLGISGIMGGILTSLKHFLVYSIAPLLYNAGIITGILIFVRIMGPVGLAWGVVFGAFMHLALQYLTVRGLGYHHSWSFSDAFKNNDVKRVLKLMLPRVAGIGVNQFNSLITTGFASILAAGSFAVFNFSTNLQSVPFSIFGLSFSIAVFPALSAFAARDEKDRFVKAFSETFRQILFFIIPISVFMLVLRAQIVRVVLGAGKFDWNATILTFQCLGILVLALFAQSTIQLLVRAFYALQDTRTPFYIAVASEIVYILSLFLLIQRMQVLGLAMAVALQSFAQMLLLLFFLRTRFDNLDDKNIIRSLVKIGLASFAAGIGIQATKYLTSFVLDLDHFVEVFAQLTISSFVGLLIFITISYVVKLEEFMTFKNSLTKKLFKHRQAAVIAESADEVGGI